MKELIKKLLREHSDNSIQEVEFNGFSDPILIPQFNKYLVKFNGTGKLEKISDSEKILFKDKETGKEYIFDSNDVQKSGNSPFYINLNVLRRNYDIRFKDEFVRHKAKLTQKEYLHKLRNLIAIYASESRCKNEKCSEVRNTIESSLKELYGDNYGTYSSSYCEPTDGFLNIFPLENTKDNNGNNWSKLNYIIYKENAISSLLMAYLKKYGTFEHGDFITWISEEKERLFKGQFLDLMIRNIHIPKQNLTLNNSNLAQIRKIFPTAEIGEKFCPSTRKNYNELITVSNNGENIIFQPVNAKSKKVIKQNNKYYILFGRRGGSPIINRKSDYILIPDGPIFKNSHVITGDRSWEFSDPPIYYEEPFQTEFKKFDKLR